MVVSGVSLTLLLPTAVSSGAREGELLSLIATNRRPLYKMKAISGFYCLRFLHNRINRKAKAWLGGDAQTKSFK
jgi:hypothetical protein